MTRFEPLDLSDDELEKIEQSLLSMLNYQGDANYIFYENDYKKAQSAAHEYRDFEYLEQAESIKKDRNKIVARYNAAQSFVKRLIAQAKIANGLHNYICKGDRS